MNAKNKISAGILIALLIILPQIIIADNGINEDSGDYIIKGFELEKILGLTNGIIALILFIITFIAYRNDGRKRFLYVSVAFLIFSIKDFLLFSEEIFPNIEWIDPFLIVLEFFVLLAFFFGVIKKEG
jgi:hypothetical protein